MSLTIKERTLIRHCIEDGIKRDIQVVQREHCDRAMLILIYAGIDAMGFLDMPAKKGKSDGSDFKRWVGTYLKFDGALQVPPGVLYKARCDALHCYGVPLSGKRTQKTSGLRYTTVDTDPPVVPCSGMISVAIPGLKKAFFRALDRFFTDVQQDPIRWKKVSSRLERFFVSWPYRNGVLVQ